MTAPSSPARPRATNVNFGSDARGRLLTAMAEAVSGSGYHDTTVADVVARAHVSRRTFYEHFEDREACFLALGEAIGDGLIALVTRAASEDLPWRERIDHALEVLLDLLLADPALNRSMQLELFGLGERGLALRRRNQSQFAEQLFALVEGARVQDPQLNPVSPEVAAALVGGIWELTMMAGDDPRPARVRAIRRAGAQLIEDVLTAPRDER